MQLKWDLTKIVTLVVSIAALLTGGFFAASWTRRVNQPDLAASILGIEQFADKSLTAFLEVPEELVTYTTKSRVLSTLKAREPRERLERSLEFARTMIRHRAESQQLKTALAKVRDDLTPSETAGIWKSLSADAKSILMAWKTSRITSEETKARMLNPSADPRWVLQQLEERRKARSSGDAEVAGSDELGEVAIAALGQTMADAVQMEREPSVELLKKYLNQAAIDELEEAMDNCSDVIPMIEHALAATPESVNTRYLVKIQVHNSGGLTESLLPAGMLCLDRQSKAEGDKDLLRMLARTSQQSIAVEPGKSSVCEFEVNAVEPGDFERISDAFKRGSVDCCAVLLRANRKSITTPAVRFSDRMRSPDWDSIEKAAKTVSIGR